MSSLSVVIPTHGRSALVPRAVESVLRQDFEGFIEVIVVFDRCEIIDLTPDDLPTNRRVTCLANDRQGGVRGARNTGILAAKSELLAFLDDDDEWLFTKVSKQVEILRANGTDAVFTGIRFVAGNRYRDYIPRLPPDEPSRGLIGGGVFLPIQTLMLRRDIHGRTLVDESFPTGGDQEYALRIVLEGSVECLDEPLVLVHRAHTARLSLGYQSRLENSRHMREKHADLYRRFDPDLSGRDARLALLAIGAGKRTEARSWALKAVRASPRRPQNWLVAGAALLLPAVGLETLQRLHHRFFWKRLPSAET